MAAGCSFLPSEAVCDTLGSWGLIHKGKRKPCFWRQVKPGRKGLILGSILLLFGSLPFQAESSMILGMNATLRTKAQSQLITGPQTNILCRVKES